MNGFNLSDIQDARLGGTQLSAIYLGSSKLWPTVIDYSKEYLTIESLEDDNEISYKLYKSGSVSTLDIPISYSTDGITWNTKTGATTSGNVMVTLNTGDKLYLKGTNSYYTNATTWGNTIYATKTANVYGNIMSLINGDNFVNTSFTVDSNRHAFGHLFRSSNIVDASNLILPSNVDRYCYYSMFYGCTSLTTAPELPATTLIHFCYNSMFYGCTSLTTAPDLPATELKQGCYQSMFYNCTSLTTAPALPATTLASTCYNSMFYNCTSLTTAPALPATTLASTCYNSMFYNCTSLTTAPDLLATTLTTQCYSAMFKNCTSLNYIKAMFTTTPSTQYTNNWVQNVSPTGTFVKNSEATWTTTGNYGIPSGWTVVNV